MMKHRVASSLFLLFLLFAAFPVPASSQDLNKLLERSNQLWALRLKAEKAKAADFVERDSRGDFPMYETLREATIEGIDFTPEKTKALVRVKTRIFDPRLGTFQQMVTEPWVYTGGNWFLHVEWVKEGPFDQRKDQPSAQPKQFTFRFAEPQLDLGAHKQGETITGSVRFTAPRAMLRDVRALGFPGLRIGQTQWIDADNGSLNFTIDTTLISKDIEQDVEFEATGPQMLFETITSTARLKLTGKIEGTVSIVQLEQTLAAKAGRFVELEIRNLSAAAFRIVGVRRSGPTYFLDDSVEVPMQLSPGQPVKFPIHYSGSQLDDGEIYLQLSPGVLPKDNVLIRFQREAAPAPPGATQQPLTREKLDSLVEDARREAQREADRERIRKQ